MALAWALGLALARAGWRLARALWLRLAWWWRWWQFVAEDGCVHWEFVDFWCAWALGWCPVWALDLEWCLVCALAWALWWWWRWWLVSWLVEKMV